MLNQNKPEKKHPKEKNTKTPRSKNEDIQFIKGKKFHLKKKDSETQKKPWQEKAETEEEMEEEIKMTKRHSKLHRVVHGHQ